MNRFQHAFAELVRLSDSLRTVVRELDGEPLRFVRDDLAGTTEFLNMAGVDLTRWAADRCRGVFPLDRCLFDSVLLETEPGRFVWYLCLHHLIADGWSRGWPRPSWGRRKRADLTCPWNRANPKRAYRGG